MAKRSPSPLLTGLLLLSLLLAACGGGGNNSSGPSFSSTPQDNAQPGEATQPAGNNAAATSGATGPSANKGGKLVLWDTATSGTQKGVIETLAKEFEKDHPGVSIEHKAYPFDELQKTLQRAITSGKGPDIAQINNGENSMGPLVRAKLLVPLEKYDRQYGWSRKFSPALLARNRYTDDGKTFGEGTLWGVSQNGEIVGFYYNRKMLQENGIQVPKTFADLEKAMDTLKSKHVTPLVFGNLDKFPAIHLYGSIEGALAPQRAYLDKLIYRQGNESFDTQPMKQAAARLQDWVKRDYLIKNYSGIGEADAWKIFAAGKGAMLLQGSWLAGDLAKAMGDNVGFFATPSQNSQPALYVGGVGIPYGVIKTTKDPDMAAKFIDFLVSDRAVELMIKSNTLPAIQVPNGMLKQGTLSGDLYAAWNKANKENRIGHYMDWATPTFYDTLTANLQLLLADKETPDAFTRALEKDYAKFLKEQQ